MAVADTGVADIGVADIDVAGMANLLQPDGAGVARHLRRLMLKACTEGTFGCPAGSSIMEYRRTRLTLGGIVLAATPVAPETQPEPAKPEIPPPNLPGPEIPDPAQLPDPNLPGPEIPDPGPPPRPIPEQA